MDKDSGFNPDASALPFSRFHTVGAVIVIGVAAALVFIFLLGVTTQPEPVFSQSYNMTATSYRDATGIEMPVSNVGDIIVRFERDGNITGFSGCNEYYSAYIMKKNRIAIIYPLHTNLTCNEPGIMEQEKSFYSDMAQATSFSTSAVGMKLFDSSGKLLIEFLKW
ncbi:MAG: META domain-containing protein [Methanoregula sp.]|jgi:heat shock protein HslJ